MSCKLVPVILAVFMLTACSSGPPGISPDQLASKFYDAVIKKDFHTAASLFGKRLPEEAHITELEDLQKSMGDLQSYKLQDSIVNTVFSGKRYIYTYRLQYAKGPVTEMLIMFEDVRGDPLYIEYRNYKLKHHAANAE